MVGVLYYGVQITIPLLTTVQIQIMVEDLNYGIQIIIYLLTTVQIQIIILVSISLLHSTTLSLKILSI